MGCSWCLQLVLLLLATATPCLRPANCLGLHNVAMFCLPSYSADYRMIQQQALASLVLSSSKRFQFIEKLLLPLAPLQAAA